MYEHASGIGQEGPRVRRASFHGQRDTAETAGAVA